MPWKEECSVMDERLQFVARRLSGEPMAELCREFGIRPNRLQNLRSLPGMRSLQAHRPNPLEARQWHRTQFSSNEELETVLAPSEATLSSAVCY
jgi:transposase-like protein